MKMYATTRTSRLCFEATPNLVAEKTRSKSSG